MIKNIALILCGSFAAIAFVGLALGAHGPGLVHRPVAATGVALIGLGACIESRRRTAS